MKVWQTKIQSGKEDSYQKLVEVLIHVQKESAHQQQNLAVELSEVKKRLASIETILKKFE